MDLQSKINALEKKLSIQEFSPQHQLLNVSLLQQKDMDIKSFFQTNFVKKGLDDNLEIDYDKMNQMLPYLQQIQQQTCEEIAVSVDINLEEYVQISQRLSNLTQNLNLMQNKYELAQNKLECTKEKLQEKIYQINVIQENLKLINTLDFNMKNLRSLVKKIETIQESLPIITGQNEPDYQSLLFAYQIIQARDQYQNQIDICAHCRQLSQKFQLIQNINTSYHQYQNYLEKLFVIALNEIQKSDQNLISDLIYKFALLLQCFIILQVPKTPEKLIIQFIIKPQFDILYQNLLQCKSQLIKQVGSFDGKNPLFEFNEKILQISQKYSEIIQRALDQLPNQPFSFNVMLFELVYIYLSQKDCAFIYSVGVPDLFHQNFLAIQDLKSQLNIDSNKINETDKRFQEKWNLNQYFSIRQNQIVRAFEQDLQKVIESVEQQIAHEIVEQRNYGLKEILISHLQKCFSPQIFLKQICSKFVRLSLQLTVRFCQIIQKIVDDKQLIGEDGSKLTISNDLTIGLCETWEALKNKNIFFHQQQIQPEFLQSMEQLRDNIQQKLYQVLSLFVDIIMIPITNQCYQNLEPFNGIPAKFRMTNRENPSQPSNFTGNILRPLFNFLTKTVLDQSVLRVVKLKVSQLVFRRFIQIKENILDGCKKQEQLMQKLGVQKSQEITDLEKIKKQLDIDEVELLTIIESKFEIQRSQIHLV